MLKEDVPKVVESVDIDFLDKVVIMVPLVQYKEDESDDESDDEDESTIINDSDDEEL